MDQLACEQKKHHQGQAEGKQCDQTIHLVEPKHAYLRGSGLHRVHFTWAGTFVLESLVYLFPDKHFVLIDTDCVPTSLFEIEELARLMWQRDTDVDMVDDEVKSCPR